MDEDLFFESVLFPWLDSDVMSDTHSSNNWEDDPFKLWEDEEEEDEEE